MVSLIVHLVKEIELCDLIYIWWMYPVKLYKKILIEYTKNLHYPEASIVERYIAEKDMEFCLEYIENAKPDRLSESRYDEWEARVCEGYML